MKHRLLLKAIQAILDNFALSLGLPGDYIKARVLESKADTLKLEILFGKAYLERCNLNDLPGVGDTQ